MPNDKKIVKQIPDEQPGPSGGEILNEGQQESVEQILKKFVPDKYRKMGNLEVLRELQKLENNLAAESGRKPYQVRGAGSSAETIGLADKERQTLNVKLSYNPYGVLHTLLHESRHASQYELIQERKRAVGNHQLMGDYKKNVEKHGLTDKDLLVMSWETDNYSNNDTNQYHMQFVEADAEISSYKFLVKHKGLLGGNGQFDLVIQQLENKMNDLKDAFNDDEMVKNWSKDRQTRHGNTGQGGLSQEEQRRLGEIYASGNIKQGGFSVIKDINSFERKNGLRE